MALSSGQPGWDGTRTCRNINKIPPSLSSKFLSSIPNLPSQASPILPLGSITREAGDTAETWSGGQEREARYRTVWNSCTVIYRKFNWSIFTKLQCVQNAYEQLFNVYRVRAEMETFQVLNVLLARKRNWVTRIFMKNISTCSYWSWRLYDVWLYVNIQYPTLKWRTNCLTVALLLPPVCMGS